MLSPVTDCCCCSIFHFQGIVAENHPKLLTHWLPCNFFYEPWQLWPQQGLPSFRTLYIGPKST